MVLKIDLKSVERIVRGRFDAYSLKKIEKSLDEYLEESTKENIAKTIGFIYQGARKNFKLRKSTARTRDEFWGEITRLWHCADSACCTHYYHINGGLPFNYKISKDASWLVLKSIYGDIFTAYHIAEHETLGGLHAVTEAMIKRMGETSETSFISNLIYKHFEKYRKNFHAVQYIAVKYLLKYRPDLQSSQYKNYMFCTYKKLEQILTMHLEEYKY